MQVHYNIEIFNKLAKLYEVKFIAIKRAMSIILVNDTRMIKRKNHRHQYY